MEECSQNDGRSRRDICAIAARTPWLHQGQGHRRPPRPSDAVVGSISRGPHQNIPGIHYVDEMKNTSTLPILSILFELVACVSPAVL